MLFPRVSSRLGCRAALRHDLLQQHARRLVVRVLRREFAGERLGEEILVGPVHQPADVGGSESEPCRSGPSSAALARRLQHSPRQPLPPGFYSDLDGHR